VFSVGRVKNSEPFCPKRLRSTGPTEPEDWPKLLKAGDVLVQRGTIHNWVNKGTVPCVIAFVLVAAKPVTAGGKVLNAVG
jgi:hypothetical protein